MISTPPRTALWILLLAVVAIAIPAASFALLPLRLAVAGTLLGWMMLAITISDAERYIVPDVLSLPAIPAGLLASGSLAFPGAHALVDPGHVIGAVLGGFSLWALREMYLRSRGIEALGLGDVKLAAAAGAWTGWQGLPNVLLLAATAALLAAAWMWSRGNAVDRATRLPFGAFLAPALWIVWLVGAVG